jgi:hypothetical protein
MTRAPLEGGAAPVRCPDDCFPVRGVGEAIRLRRQPLFLSIGQLRGLFKDLHEHFTR